MSLTLLFLIGCAKDEPAPKEALTPPLDKAVVARVDPARIRDHVEVLADDALGGRIPGSVGSAQARDYLVGEMIEVGLEPLGLDGAYTWEYPNEPSADSFMLDATGAVVPHQTSVGTNLIGVIPGADPVLAEEVMVVMAHYDHLGVDEDGAVYNGAFDNATAVGMNLEIARALIDSGTRFDRTLVFLFTDDEEFGLDGADEWIRDPSVPQENVVFGVSTDPLGRAMLPDFAPIVLIGLERAPAFEAVWREAALHVEGPIYFVNRDIIPIFASDQDPFWEQDTPALWFTNIGFTWYHTTGDVAETIDYRIVLRDADLLMQALAIAGNTDERYAYNGPVPPAGQAARDAKKLFVDMKQSAYPSTGDREQADFLIEQLDAVIAADSTSAVDSAEALYTAGLYYLLFDLPQKYPGEVPPPFPAKP